MTQVYRLYGVSDSTEHEYKLHSQCNVSLYNLDSVFGF